jgi:hypothetical protein
MHPGFKSIGSTTRLCRSYGEFRNFLRIRYNQHATASCRRLMHIRYARAALAICKVASVNFACTSCRQVWRER